MSAWLCFSIKPLGAPGLALATVGVNFFSTVALLWCLDRKIHGLDWRGLGLPIFALIGASFLTGLASWGVSRGLQEVWQVQGLFMQLLQLGLSALAGLVVFAVCATQLRLPEIDMFVSRIRQRIGRG